MRLALAATLALLAVPALAQNTQYTGCLKSSDGSLYYVREGTAPMAPCQKRDRQIGWNMAGQPGPQGPPGTSIPQLLQLTVDCSQPGASINAALSQQAERLTVEIVGNCVEEVYIRRDDVTLQGAGTDPTITAPAGANGAIRIPGARGVRLENLHLKGGVFVIDVGDGASLHGQNLKVTDGTTGLYIAGASANLGDCEISHNQGDGAHADPGSVLTFANSRVIDNGACGLAVQGAVVVLGTTAVEQNPCGVYARNGRIFMWGAWPTGGGTVLDGGVSLEATHLLLSSYRIANSGGPGISAYDGSVAVLGAATIENNNGGGVSASRGSVVRLNEPSIINGGQSPGISLYDTSIAGGAGNSTVTGYPLDIYCAPSPSVAQLTEPLPSGMSTNCQPSGQ